MTKTQLRLAEFSAKFVATHNRAPDTVERVTLKNAAALAAQVENNRAKVEDLVRCGRLLATLLGKLGLAPKSTTSSAVHTPLRDRLPGAGPPADQVEKAGE